MLKQIQKHLQSDEAGKPIPRLLADAKRLFARASAIDKIAQHKNQVDQELLEIACHALQLPLRQLAQLATARFGQLSLKQRCEQSSELLVTIAGDRPDDRKIDRVIVILSNVPSRTPSSDEAKLLADAVNLEDFGLTGILTTTTSIALAGQGVDALIDGAKKRDLYGYWDSRLRDGFHFAAVREIAEKRLAAARKWLEKIEAELAEDQPQ